MIAIKRFYKWIDSSLNRKYVLGMASGMIAISLLFAILFIGMYQKQLETERASTSLHLNKLLQTTLEHAMIMRDLNGLRGIIRRFGKQDNIKNVMIFNTVGQVRFAAQPEYVGQIDTGISETTEEYTSFLSSEDTGEVLRSINPIYNRNECTVCHGTTTANPINGILVVDIDATTLRENARKTTFALMGAGSTVVFITLFGGWWFMRRFVLKPVRKLLNAQVEFANESLKARVNLGGNDEISMLGKSFDNMAETIEEQWQSIERRKYFLQSLIDGIPDGVRVLDQQYNILLANNAYVKQIGVSKEKALSSKCYAVHHRTEPCIPTMEKCPLYEIKAHANPVKMLHHHKDNKGNELAVEIFAAPIHGDESWGESPIIIEIIRDLSTSVSYSQEQRLTSLGMLASGVAHEIHNPLGSIQIAFQSINNFIENDELTIEQLKYYIGLIEGEIDKCVNITGRLLKLGSLPDTYLQPISINDIITETLSLLRYESESRNILINLDFPEISPRVLGTDAELRMVILNLVQNAFHAMPEGGRLDVAVNTENDSIIIKVKDTGEGIPKDIQATVFDPFFSHRSDHVTGTGLGLAITKAIVKRFNGTINITSEEELGAIFIIVLPDADKQIS